MRTRWHTVAAGGAGAVVVAAGGSDAGSAGAVDLIAYSGGEKVSVTLTDTIKNNQNEDDVLYELYVWKVGNRFVADQKQHYTLGLISREAIINEGLRV